MVPTSPKLPSLAIHVRSETVPVVVEMNCRRLARRRPPFSPFKPVIEKLAEISLAWISPLALMACNTAYLLQTMEIEKTPEY
jgi:hypothetical protein